MMRRVIKVGGSLLKRSSVVADIDKWLSNQTAAQNFFVFGGGQMVESIRHLDQMHRLDSAMIHWLCVDLLQATFQIAGECFGNWDHIESAEELEAAVHCFHSRDHLVAVNSFYNRQNPGRLPENWSTTTDSISASLADLIDADELVLLKSCRIEQSASLVQMKDAGIIDDAFPQLAERISKVRIEQLLLDSR